MNKEVISDKQGIAIMVLFMIGPSSVSLAGVEAGRDIWLAVILSMFMALPILLVFCKLHILYPDKDFFDIVIICFGEFIGKGIIILYIWNLFVTVTTTFRNFGEFITTVSLIRTPMVIPMVFFGALCVFVVKGGIEVLGRWGNFFIPIVILFTVVLILLLIPEMNEANIRPLFSKGIKAIFHGAIKLYSFPFAQLIVFSMILTNFRDRNSPYRIYLWSLLIGGLVLLVTFTSSLLVVGADLISNMYYPTYTAISRVEIMKIGRLEILSATIFSLGGFVKISSHIFAICIGLTKIFKCQNYRFIAVPVILLLVNQAYFTWDSAMSFYEFDGEMMLYFAFPFRTIFPIVLLIFATLKKKSRLIGME